MSQYATRDIHGKKYIEYPPIFGEIVFVDADMSMDHRQHLIHYVEGKGEEWFQAHIDFKSHPTSDKHFKYEGHTGFYEIVWANVDHIGVIIQKVG